jgi:hypothetical protein
MGRMLIEPEDFLRYMGKGLLPNFKYVDCALMLYDNSLIRYIKKNFPWGEIGGFSNNCFFD